VTRFPEHHELVHETLDELARLGLSASLASEVERHDDAWPGCPRRWRVGSTHSHEASDVAFEPSGTLGSTNLQAAVEELSRTVADASGLLDGLRLAIDTTPLVSGGGTVTTSHSIDLSPAHWGVFADDPRYGEDEFGPSTWSGAAPAPRSSTLLPGSSIPTPAGGMIYYGPSPPEDAADGDLWILTPEIAGDEISKATVYDGSGWIELAPSEVVERKAW